MPTKTTSKSRSKYQQEFEEFKRKLPEVIQQTADDYNLELCPDGLKDLFNRLGVEWSPPREDCTMAVDILIKLPTNESGVDPSGVDEANEVFGKIEKLVLELEHVERVDFVELMTE